MSKPSKKVDEVCRELMGIVGMLMSDVETEEEKYFMLGTLLHSVVKGYLKTGMSFEEVHEVLSNAVPMYREMYDKKKKK
jgi:hypothetical protein